MDGGGVDDGRGCVIGGGGGGGCMMGSGCVMWGGGGGVLVGGGLDWIHAARLRTRSSLELPKAS
jgi:hypothetical protein